MVNYAITVDTSQLGNKDIINDGIPKRAECRQSAHLFVSVHLQPTANETANGLPEQPYMTVTQYD